MSGERTKTAAVGLVLAVFVLGAALGALGMYWAGRSVMAGTARRPAAQTSAERNAHVVEAFTKDLGLTPDQQKQMSAQKELGGLYGTDTSANLEAQGLMPKDVSAETQAGSSVDVRFRTAGRVTLRFG